MGFSKTIAGPVAFEGVGVHSGTPVHLRLLPAERPGIIFRRTDLENAEMPLTAERVESHNSTTLTGDRFSVRTVEHLLAALWVPGIDALTVELDADEIPILDGSAGPFAQAVQSAGITVLPFRQPTLRLVKPFRVDDGAGASVVFSPAGPGEDLDLSYTIVYDHPAIRTQSLRRPLRWDIFVREIAPARTFGFLKDVPELHRQGLALGGSFANALVLDDEKVVNGPLRFPDEFVRHKILDIIGDLYLLGYPVRGKVTPSGNKNSALPCLAATLLTDEPVMGADGKPTKALQKQAHVGHILVRVSGSQESIDGGFRKLQDFELAAKQKDFASAASEFGFEVKKSPPFAKNAAVPFVGRDPVASDFAFKREINDISGVMENSSATFVMQLAQRMPAGIASFDEARGQVALDARNAVLGAICRDTAAAITNAARAGVSLETAAKAHNVSYTTSDLFSRSAYVPYIGRDPKALGAAFTMTTTGQIIGPVEYASGAAVMTLLERVPADLTVYTEKRDSIVTAIRTTKQQEFYGRWMESLMNNATIESNVGRAAEADVAS